MSILQQVREVSFEEDDPIVEENDLVFDMLVKDGILLKKRSSPKDKFIFFYEKEIYRGPFNQKEYQQILNSQKEILDSQEKRFSFPQLFLKINDIQKYDKNKNIWIAYSNDILKIQTSITSVIFKENFEGGFTLKLNDSENFGLMSYFIERKFISSSFPLFPLKKWYFSYLDRKHLQTYTEMFLNENKNIGPSFTLIYEKNKTFHFLLFDFEEKIERYIKPQDLEYYNFYFTDQYRNDFEWFENYGGEYLYLSSLFGNIDFISKNFKNFFDEWFRIPRLKNTEVQYNLSTQTCEKFKDYDLSYVKMLDSGTFGHAMVYEKIENGKKIRYAIKRIREIHIDFFESELYFLNFASKNKIGPFLYNWWQCDFKDNQTKAVFVTELLEVTMHDYLNDLSIKNSVKLNTCLKFFPKIMFLNVSGIHHNDMHLKNIMLDKNFEPYFIDFGATNFYRALPDSQILFFFNLIKSIINVFNQKFIHPYDFLDFSSRKMNEFGVQNFDDYIRFEEKMMVESQNEIKQKIEELESQGL